MNIRRFLQGFVVMMVLVSSAAALQAQNFSLFATGGASLLFNKKYYSVYGAPYGSTYKTGSTFSVGAEIPLRKNLGVEASYGYVRNNLAVTDFYNSASLSNEKAYSIRDQRISLDAIAQAPKGIRGVRPYLVGGVEFDRFSPLGSAVALAQSSGFNGVPNATLAPDNRFGFNFGGGFDVALTGSLAFRVDLRDHLVGSPTFGLPSQTTTVYTAYYPIHGSANNVTASVGFVYHFGK